MNHHPPTDSQHQHQHEGPDPLLDLADLESSLLQPVEPQLQFTSDVEDEREERGVQQQQQQVQGQEHLQSERAATVQTSQHDDAASMQSSRSSAHSSESSQSSAVTHEQRTSQAESVTSSNISTFLNTPSAAAAAPRAYTSTPVHRYRTHLSQSQTLPSILAQAEAGQSANVGLAHFLRSKAELDRQYSVRLKEMTEQWCRDMGLPPPRTAQPTQTDSDVSAANMLSNVARFCLRLASSHSSLSLRLSDDLAESFLDAAELHRQGYDARTSRLKSDQLQLEGAWRDLNKTEEAFRKTCAELEALNVREQEEEQAKQRHATSSSASGSGASSSSSTVASTTKELFSHFVSSLRPSRSTLLKRLNQEETKYMSAIKLVRELAPTFESTLLSHLDAFERAERARWKLAVETMKRFCQVHANQLAANARTMQDAMHGLSTSLNVDHDLERFVRNTLTATSRTPASTSSSTAASTRPLPVFRLFPGHPRWTSSSSASQSQVPRRPMAGDDVDDDVSDVDEPIDSDEATDSDTDAEQHALTSASAAPAAAPQRRGSRASSTSMSSPQHLEAEATLTQCVQSILSAADEVDEGAAASLFGTDVGRSMMPVVLQRAVDTAAAAASVTETSSTASVTPSSTDAELRISPTSLSRLSLLVSKCLDACLEHDHPSPMRAILHISQHIVSEEEKEEEKGDEKKSVASERKKQSKSADIEDSTSTPGPVRLLDLIPSHPAACSLRLWELSFFSSLSRANERHAPFRLWQSDAEQEERIGEQKRIAFKLIQSHANDMMQYTKIDDQHVCNFVEKLAHAHQLDASSMQQLLQLPCFQRRDLPSMPSHAAASHATQSLPISEQQRQSQPTTIS